MNLKETIIRVLREESDKDLTRAIQRLLNMFVDNHKDILCRVEVIHPNKRIKLPEHMYDHEHYAVYFYFIGGYGSVNWPATTVIMIKFDKLMNEAWDFVYNYTGQKIDVFTKHVKSCD